MNTLFIDVENFKNIGEKKLFKESKIEKENNQKYKESTSLFSKISGFEVKNDIMSYGCFYNNMKLNIDLELLKGLSNNKVNIVFKKTFEIILKSKLKKVDSLNLVFSKKLDEKDNEVCKKYILKILSSIKGINLKEIVISNKMNINDVKYIDEYIKKSNINPNKLKILVALDNIEDYSDKKMIEYISKYKYVDVLKMAGIDKRRYKNLNESIDKINNEYGSTIEITQRRNIQEYNVYLVYSKINKDEFKSHYILRKKSKVLYMNDEEEDILNLNFKAYEKYKYNIETLFNRIGVELEHYSKNKLGALMLEDEEETALLDI